LILTPRRAWRGEAAGSESDDLPAPDPDLALFASWQLWSELAFARQSLGAGGTGEELHDEPHWVVTDARNDLADGAGVAGDGDVLVDLKRLIVVDVAGGDDLVAAT
jgi:hypothetical protein